MNYSDYPTLSRSSHGIFIISLDLDECLSGVDGCHENGICRNLIGSYNCTCGEKNGKFYQGNGTHCQGLKCCLCYVSKNWCQGHLFIFIKLSKTIDNKNTHVIKEL